MLRLRQFRYRIHLPTRVRIPAPSRAAGCVAWALFSFSAWLVVCNVLSEASGLRFCQPFRDDHLNKVAFCQREVHRPSVVYLGSSQIHNGIMPALVEQAAAEKGLSLEAGYNLGIGSTGLEIAHIVARDVLVGEQQPRIVVVGICPLLLIAETADTPRNLCLFGSWGDVVDGVIRRRMPVQSLADIAFRGPKNLVEYPLRSWGEPHARSYRSKHLRRSQGGRWLLEETGEARTAPPEAWRQQVEMLPPLPQATFRDDCRAARALLNIKRLAEERGWELVLVDPPQHPDLHRRQLPEGTEEAYRQWLAGFVSRHGFRHLDLTEPGLYVHDDFGDPVHLNAKGAARLSRRLGQALAHELQQP